MDYQFEDGCWDVYRCQACNRMFKHRDFIDPCTRQYNFVLMPWNEKEATLL